jgi:hypothetical protein
LSPGLREALMSALGIMKSNLAITEETVAEPPQRDTAGAAAPFMPRRP